jgi:hypothetical protein
MLQSTAEGVYTGLTIGAGTTGPGPNVAALAFAAGTARARAAVAAAKAAVDFRRDIMGGTSLSIEAQIVTPDTVRARCSTGPFMLAKREAIAGKMGCAETSCTARRRAVLRGAPTASDRHYRVALARALDDLALGHLQRAAESPAVSRAGR